MLKSFLMSITAKFKGNIYKIQLTDHAKARMLEREVSDDLLQTIVETGATKPKPNRKSAFWVFATIPGRTDNLICLSLIIEGSELVIKTVLINWRPQ
jgi:hypothetical protein